MPLPRHQKNSFTAGEITPRLFGRGDLKAYENGAAKLRNVVIHPTGGVSRRPGLRFLDTLAGKSRLAAFEFNTEQTYLLAFSDQAVRVYKDDLLTATLVTPWTEDQLAQINWTQSADTLLVVHPDVPPKKITRTSHTDWTVTDWSFASDNDAVHQPYHKFADPEVTMAASGTSGSVTLTASADHFEAAHVGVRFRIEQKQVEITAVASPTSATADVKESLGSTSATEDWDEQAFSDARGWPVSVCFHQDRLVVGGARDLPNRLWLSKSSELFNFDLGEGLDDEAIEFSILSDSVNAIRAVFSGRHLQVFTSGAEWMVTGSPLTPENVQLNRQTRIGAPVDRTVPPRDVDGATLFVSRHGDELREFLFADVAQAYQAADLALLAQHLLRAPLDQDYDTARRLFHLVNADGTLATVTVYRSEQVTAWSLSETDGAIGALAVVDGTVYLAVERNSTYLLEKFDAALNVDSGLTGASASPKTTWSGLDHLEGRTVKVTADGALRNDAVVDNGAVTLDQPASAVEIGLAYAHRVEPLPPAAGGTTGARPGSKVRLVALTLRLMETAALCIDLGKGFKDQPFKKIATGGILDTPPVPFSGDKTLRALGWKQDGTQPLWVIEQDRPLPFTLLSATADIKVTG